MAARDRGWITNLARCALVLASAGPAAAALAATQVKNLYLDNGSGTILTRTPSTSTAVTAIAEGATATFTLSPTTATAMTLPAGTIPVGLWLARQGSGGQTGRSITVTLDYTGGSTGSLGTLTRNITFGLEGVLQFETFNVVQGSAASLNANTAIRVLVTINSDTGIRDAELVPLNAGSNSRVELNSDTVIAVNSVQSFDAASPGGALATNFPRLTTAYLRAVVSDPFGAYDIAPTGGTVPTIVITDPTPTVQVNGATMTQIGSTASTKTYEYAYPIAGGAVTGSWSYAVTAYEGTEGTVTASNSANFTVLGAHMSVAKSSAPVSDPHNGTLNPKRIPGAVVRYTLTVANAASANASASATTVTDAIPANLTYMAGSLRRSADAACDDSDTALTDAYDAADDGSISGTTITFGDSNGGTDLTLAPNASLTYCYRVTVD
jgi:uncharacterized repeat protein (TIGR01451 family)